MNPCIRILAVSMLTALCGCQTLTDIANAIPPLTPQQQCEDTGGRWISVTTYDANGTPTQTGECISK
jgi:hypothetical protein